MGRKLRVFVSSTMRDLANERAEVLVRLEQFNFEPVNAEDWRPTGLRPWDRIRQEIASSDVFLLVLGDRYGWIPDGGPGAESGKSVTHLEYLAARDQRLPILPFLKDIPYDADRESDDARKRDAFRKEVAEWKGGQLVWRFQLARDLCEAVGRALVDLLWEDLQGRIRERAAEADVAAQAISDTDPVEEPELPPALIEDVRLRESVLFAGTGVTRDAGYPAAAAWGEFLMQRIRERVPDYSMSATAENVRRIAGDLEFVAGRAALLAAVRTLLTPPQMVRVTEVHRAAVRHFGIIVTSNFDNLFETASHDEGQAHALIHSELRCAAPEGDYIVKLHGSFEFPDTMILTEEQANAPNPHRQALFAALRQIFSSRRLVVIGSSLRDPSTAGLFSSAVPSLSGYYVDPVLAPAAVLNAERWNLQPIRATAAGFFGALNRSLAKASGRDPHTS